MSIDAAIAKPTQNRSAPPAAAGAGAGCDGADNAGEPTGLRELASVPLARLAQIVRARATDIYLGADERALSQRNAISAFTVRVASAALLYLMQVVLARWMGGYEYGIYVFVWTWVLVLGGLAPLGLDVAVIRLIPEYRERGQTSLLRGILFGARLSAFFVGCAIAGAGLFGIWAFHDIVTNHYVLPAYLAMICLPLYALATVQDGIGRGYAWMNLALVPPYIVRPLLILLTMVGAHEAGLPMAASTAAAAAIIGTLLATVLQLVLMNRRIARNVEAVPRQTEFDRWLPMSAPLLAITACELVFQNADVLIISTFMDPQSVGIYFAAAKTMSLILFVHYAVGSAVANRFSALKARGDTAELKAAVHDAVHWTFWPSLAGAAVILSLGQPLLSLFGPDFTAGYPVMFILVIGFLFRSAMGPAEYLLNMLGEQSRCAQVLVGSAILNVILNLCLVPPFGLIGAACATSASMMIAALLNYVVVRKRLGLEIAIWKNM